LNAELHMTDMLYSSTGQYLSISMVQSKHDAGMMTRLECILSVPMECGAAG
jgi:hypothetical protein